MNSKAVKEKGMEKYTRNSIGRAAIRMVILSLRGLIVFGLGLLLVVLRAWQRF